MFYFFVLLQLLLMCDYRKGTIRDCVASSTYMYTGKQCGLRTHQLAVIRKLYHICTPSLCA